jgi:hypothetical protein
MTLSGLFTGIAAPLAGALLTLSLLTLLLRRTAARAPQRIPSAPLPRPCRGGRDPASHLNKKRA